MFGILHRLVKRGLKGLQLQGDLRKAVINLGVPREMPFTVLWQVAMPTTYTGANV